MPPPRIAILSSRRCGAQALYRLLAPTMQGRLAGGQPFHWDNVWGDVSRVFHEGQPEHARSQLDAYLEAGALFHHHYDVESWGFNEMLLAGLARSGFRLLVIERDPTVEHLFSVIVSEHLKLSDAVGVQRWRERLRAGAAVDAFDLDQVRRQVQLWWQTRGWFRRVVGTCAAERWVCSHERLFLRGVSGLAAVDEVFAFAGLGPRDAWVDDASLLRFLFNGHHYTAGLAAYSATLRAVRDTIEDELSRLQAVAGSPNGETQAHG